MESENTNLSVLIHKIYFMSEGVLRLSHHVNT